METEDPIIIDVAEEISREIIQSGILFASIKGSNVLVLSKLDTPIKRFDGKTSHYRVEHRWLSNPNDVHAV